MSCWQVLSLCVSWERTCSPPLLAESGGCTVLQHILLCPLGLQHWMKSVAAEWNEHQIKLCAHSLFVEWPRAENGCWMMLFKWDCLPYTIMSLFFLFLSVYFVPTCAGCCDLSTPESQHMAEKQCWGLGLGVASFSVLLGSIFFIGNCNFRLRTGLVTLCRVSH